MFLSVLFIVAGMVLLVKGSDTFVEAAAKIARMLGVSTFVIGLSLVAIGTSLPEFAAAVLASYYGSGGLAIGNIIGSNIANICLVLAVPILLFSKFKVSKRVFDRDCLLLLMTTLIFIAVSLDGIISFLEGLLLFVSFCIYIAYLFKFIRTWKDVFDFGTYLKIFYRLGYGLMSFGSPHPSDGTKIHDPSKNFALFLIGLAGILIGAHLLVTGAKGLALLFGLQEELIGLTLIALGTSLPELAVSITSLRKGLFNIMVGDVIGSNIANILLVGGISAMVNPLILGGIVFLPMVLMALATLFFVFAVYGDWQLNKREAMFFLFLYVIFIALLF